MRSKINRSGAIQFPHVFMGILILLAFALTSSGQSKKAQKADGDGSDLPDSDDAVLDLSLVPGEFDVSWFNPREGGSLFSESIVGGSKQVLLNAPSENKDWLAIVKRRKL